jgi:type 1 fimbria pilin
MKRWSYSALIFLSLQAHAITAGPNFTGKATMQGEVLASGCTISFPDQFQTVSFGDIAIRDIGIGNGHLKKKFHITLDNCYLPDKGTGPEVAPDLRIRFEGIQGEEAEYFLPSGTGRGVSLIVRDSNNDIMYPGAYSKAYYSRNHKEQTMGFSLELVPDGRPLRPGEYYAALRFNINYD